MSRSGFFKESTLISKPPAFRVARCESCKLYLGCKSPKMPVTGKGKKKILIIGEAPGKNEDIRNKQFVGESGQLLAEHLYNVGIDLRQDCWITNAIICRPPNNRTPKEKEIEYCRPNLTKTLADLKPEIIIPLGGVAVASLIAPLWKEKIGPIARWVGWEIPSQELNAWIIPNWHPSYVMRMKSDKAQQGKILSKLFEHNLKKAAKLEDLRPWDEVPNYTSEVRNFYDDKHVPRLIQRMIGNGNPISFDLETNMLKPEADEASIICCSVSDGNTTASFPWIGENIEAMKDLLRSRVPKWGQNIKFEDRWIKKHLGIRVRNWEWDAMLGMHWLDNRRGITGLKFQSFVLLGFGSYDDHINKFLKAKSSNTVNRIRDIEMSQLLRYCGLDSLLEHKIAHQQRSILNADVR